MCVCALVLEFLPVLSHYCQYYARLHQFFDIYANKMSKASIQTVSAFLINVCVETQPCRTFVTGQFWVVADLIVKLAKDKFGALQTEYQKVTVGVFKRISVWVFFALLLFAFLVFFVCSHYHFEIRRELQIFTLFHCLTAFRGILCYVWICMPVSNDFSSVVLLLCFSFDAVSSACLLVSLSQRT